MVGVEGVESRYMPLDWQRWLGGMQGGGGAGGSPGGPLDYRPWWMGAPVGRVSGGINISGAGPGSSYAVVPPITGRVPLTRPVLPPVPQRMRPESFYGGGPSLSYAPRMSFSPQGFFGTSVGGALPFWGPATGFSGGGGGTRRYLL